MLLGGDASSMLLEITLLTHLTGPNSSNNHSSCQADDEKLHFVACNFDDPFPLQFPFPFPFPFPPFTVALY